MNLNLNCNKIELANTNIVVSFKILDNGSDVGCVISMRLEKFKLNEKLLIQTVNNKLKKIHYFIVLKIGYWFVENH